MAEVTKAMDKQSWGEGNEEERERGEGSSRGVSVNGMVGQ